MSDGSPRLVVAMYHYVRDVERTQFPGLHAVRPDAFARQVWELSARYEMATLRSALAFLDGTYRPDRDLCLLTFDDGVKDHRETVLPVLHRLGIQGSFFIITSSFEGKVSSAHKNQFLMASLPFDAYAAEVRSTLSELAPDVDARVDPSVVASTYRWDRPEVGALKYFLNFALPTTTRDHLLTKLFVRHFGNERDFAASLYLDRQDVRALQDAGMIVGGHSHAHEPLARLDPPSAQRDLARCTEILFGSAAPQDVWPFSYPYGKDDTFTHEISSAVRALGYACAFTTEPGANSAAQDIFRLRRLDAKELGVK